MKIAVVNPKGGVGKTTIATQILPIFFADTDYEVVEIDISNKTATISGGDSLTLEPNKLLKTLSLKENLIMDVGGNESAREFIRLVTRYGLVEEIDTVVIPILYEDADSIEVASDIIRSLPKAMTILALNRVPVEIGEIDKFMWDEALRKLEAESGLPVNEGKQIFAIPDMGDLFVKLKKQGLSISEMLEAGLGVYKNTRKELAKKIFELEMKKKSEGLTVEEETLLRKLNKELDEAIEKYLLGKEVNFFVEKVILPQKSVFNPERINELLLSLL